MPFDFPSTPTEGQTYTPVGGPTYVYNAPKWNVQGDGGGAAPADFRLALETALNASEMLDWTWGDVTLTSPAVVNLGTGDHISGGGLDMHGAKIICGFVDTSQDLLIIQGAVGLPSTRELRGMTFKDILMWGQGACRNGLVFKTNGNANIYGCTLNRVSSVGCAKSGILMYGNVFETDVISSYLADNGEAGLELRNPTAGTGNGVISSIKIFGGDFRTNKYGIATSADTAYQEPAGFIVYGADFIANQSAAILASSGLQLVDSCHMENNCNAATPEMNAAIKMSYGSCTVRNTQAPENNTKQTRLIEVYGTGSTITVTQCYCFDQTDFSAHPLVVTTGGNGTIRADVNDPSLYVISGTWALELGWVPLNGGTMTGGLNGTFSTWSPPVNTAAFSAAGYSLTGSNATSAFRITGTLNTTGTPDVFAINITDTSNSGGNAFAIRGGPAAVNPLINVSLSGDTRVAGWLQARQLDNLQTNGRDYFAYFLGNGVGGNIGMFAGLSNPTFSTFGRYGSIYLNGAAPGLPYYNNNGTTGWDRLVGETSTQTLTNKTFAPVSISPGTNGQVLTTVAGAAAWAAASGGASISVGVAPPGSPTAGALWWNTDAAVGGGQLFIYYNDGTSSQWVPASPGAAALTTPGGDFMASLANGWLIQTASAQPVVLNTIMTGNSGGWYSTSTGRFTPPAGRYSLFGSTYAASTASGATGLYVHLYKNGVNIAGPSASWSYGVGAPAFASTEATVDANGSDYFEFRAQAAPNSMVTGNAYFGAFPISGVKGPPGDPGVGLLQTVSYQTGAVATGTTIIPWDDTIPQISEGTEFMTCAITPRSATSKLMIEVVAGGAVTVAATVIAALFQDATANALAAICSVQPTATAQGIVSFRHTMTSGTTSATTFRVRIGPHTAGTYTFNGSGTRVFGGVMASSIVIQEVL